MTLQETNYLLLEGDWNMGNQVDVNRGIVEGEDEHFHQDEESLSRVQSLSMPLKLLFAFNGATEGLPTLALTSIINDRMKIPLAYIPAYYAIEFLPYSLKPLYAVATNAMSRILRKDILLIVLLVLSAVMIQITCLLREGQIFGCFAVAFSRGICISWAEFLVGVNLILTSRLLAGYEAGEEVWDKFKRQQRQEELLSTFQSEAATARNVGSLLAHFVTFGMLLKRHKYSEETDDDANEQSPMSDELVNIMLMITSLFPLAASFVAFRYRLYQRQEYSAPTPDGNDVERSSSSVGLGGFMKREMVSLLFFQAILVVIGMKTIIIAYTSETWFVVISISLATFMLLSILYARVGSSRIHLSSRYSATNSIQESRESGSNPRQHLAYIKRVALYLILRHSTPSSGVMISSYTYTKLRSRPLLLQSIALLGSVAAVSSSWTYGKKIARRFSSLSGLKKIIIITTIASSVWSLLSISFIHVFREQENNIIPKGFLFVGLYAAFKLSEGFLGELTFLPSVILATTSTAHEGMGPGDHDACPLDHEDQTEQVFDDSLETADEDRQHCRLDDGLQYGLLIACIDFGDQLSGFVSMPVVEMLGLSRENEWKNLELFVVICSLLSIGSLLFLRLLFSNTPADSQ